MGGGALREQDILEKKKQKEAISATKTVGLQDYSEGCGEITYRGMA